MYDQTKGCSIAGAGSLVGVDSQALLFAYSITVLCVAACVGCWDDERGKAWDNQNAESLSKALIKDLSPLFYVCFLTCFVKSNLADKLEKETKKERKSMKWKEEGWRLMTRICLTQNNRRRRRRSKGIAAAAFERLCFLCSCHLLGDYASAYCTLSFPASHFHQLPFNPYLKKRLSDFKFTCCYFLVCVSIIVLLFFCVSLCAALVKC